MVTNYDEIFNELNNQNLTNKERELLLEKIPRYNNHLSHPIQKFDSKSVGLYGLEKLLERDKEREKDGFHKKIRIGKIIKPSKSNKDKFVIVPATEEEKFLHDNSFSNPEEGGSGEGKEGDVIGERPLAKKEHGEGEGAGEGDAGEHNIDANAYEIGKILMEEFELPNLQEKGKKRSPTKFKYELTDKNRRFGQLIDKRETLKNIIKTNYSLGNIKKGEQINLPNLIINPNDKVYHLLSKEIEYEPQAMVFFLRDYSGSMEGASTDIVVQQHLFIYSWLMYQYKKNVKNRFIVHDTSAKEVPSFYDYYNSSVAGGTKVSSAFNLTNKIIEEENIAKDYNIYVFHGTDGDDWDNEGKETIQAINKLFSYVNRIGITIAQNYTRDLGGTTMQKYIEGSGLLDSRKDLIRLDSMKAEDADEGRIIEGIKKLVS